MPTDEDPSSFFQQAKYTINLPESFEFAKDFRSTCNEFGEKLSIGEVTGGRKIIRKFLGDETNNGLTLVFDFEMLNFKFTADYFRDLIRTMERHYPDPFMPVYVFSNHDKHRSMYRLGNDLRTPFASPKGKQSERGRKAKLLAMFQLTVRGVPCMYYGEEIGMTDAKFPFAAALDPIPHKFTFAPRFVFDLLGVLINRDEVRTPMQWDGTRNAGFSSAQKTWLPVHENYRSINVEKQRTESDSLLNMIQVLLKIRQQESCLQGGSLEILENLPKGVLGYTRILEDKKILVLLNFDEQEKEFEMENSGKLFNLCAGDQAENKTIHLAGYGGLLSTTL
jgi:alpha-glucosidase